MSLQSPQSKNKNNPPPQRKTTLKWDGNGELSSVDMARILYRLSNPQLTECDLTCSLNAKPNKRSHNKALQDSIPATSWLP